jgi:hypothetical protein
MGKKLPKAAPNPSFHNILRRMRYRIDTYETPYNRPAFRDLYELGKELEDMGKRGATDDELYDARFIVDEIRRFASLLSYNAYQLHPQRDAE